MKKHNKFALSFIASFLILSLSSCGQNVKENTESKQTLISLSYNEKTISFGEKFQIIAVYKTNGFNEVIWESDNESVAIVDNGQVTAVGIGDAVISATFSGETVTCIVHVKMSNAVPALHIMNLSDDEINIVKNDKFNIEGKVFYDGTYYDCNLKYEIENKNIVETINGQLYAKNIGSSFVTVSTVWRNFENSLLSKTFKVNVTNSVLLYTSVSLNNTTTITNTLDLSIVGEFVGKKYNCSAIVKPFCMNNDVEQSVSYSVSDNSVIDYNFETGIISSKNVGTSIISYTYFDEESNKKYVSNLLINVYSPVEIYSGETLEFCTENDFPVAKYFGDDAKILSAFQGEKELTIKRGKVLNGIVSKGKETAPITVTTNKGSFVFNNLFVYDRALTNSNINESLTLMDGKIINKYFVLNEDLIGADMTTQGESKYKDGASTNSYFCGTLDGRGHTLSVKVGLNGLFGGFGDGAIIKNAHLHFDFATPGSGQKCSGIARNAGVYVKNFAATLQNLCITAEHFQERCYAIYDMKLNDTRMYDVYVDLSNSGIAELGKFTKTGEGRGCLYNTDSILMNGPKSSFTGNIRNALVVTGTNYFLPLGDVNQSGNIYVSYAKNDASYLGLHHRHQGNPNDGGYCIAVYDKDAGDPNNEHLNYFGNLPTNLNGGAHVAWIYEGQNNKLEWGIRRFNTNNALKQSGITKIGDWYVND